MTSCRHIVTLLSAYYDGELSAEQTRRVEAHIAECAACRSRYEQLASVSARVEAHPQIVPSPDFDVRVVTAAVAQAQRMTWMDRVEAWLARPLLRLGVSLVVALLLSAAAEWTVNRISPASTLLPPSVAQVDLDRLDRFYAGVWTRQGLRAPQTSLPNPSRRTEGDAPWQKDLSSLSSQQFSC